MADTSSPKSKDITVYTNTTSPLVFTSVCWILCLNKGFNFPSLFQQFFCIENI